MEVTTRRTKNRNLKRSSHGNETGRCGDGFCHFIISYWEKGNKDMNDSHLSLAQTSPLRYRLTYLTAYKNISLNVS